MTPGFALTLSFDGISLLRRVPGGWTVVGDVALDAADLRGALADLRTEADAFGPNGGHVKLVLPNEQIKYLSIPDTGLDDVVLQDEIKRALDGATPYAVDDLTIDWAKADDTVFIAAVANETLDEAEAFAKSHHFDPVAFIASAPEGQFAGEVYFGPAASWTGDAPAKDVDPFKIVPAPAEIVPDGDPAVEPEVKDTKSFADLVEDPNVAFGNEALGEKTDADVRDALAPGQASDTTVAEPLSRPGDEDPKSTIAPSFASIRASRAAPASAPAAPPVASSVEPPSAPKPRFKLGGARKSTKNADVTASAIELDAPERSGSDKSTGFFSRRKSKPPADDTRTEPEVEASPPAPLDKPKHDPAPARAAVARIAAMRAGRDPDATDTATVPDEQQRMTVFGARTEPQIGGKPRYLGLMLTSALLVFLLAVAAWASVFLDEGLSRFFDRNDDTPRIAQLPDVGLQPLDGSITAPPEEDGVELAALDVGDIQASDTETALSDLLPPPPTLTPEEAAVRYAATGIWQKSPQAPSVPTATKLDDLYIASIDRRVEQFDAVALPSAQALRNDEAYLSQPNPPVPGSRYDLDDRGLVVATPQGTVNPEGVRVFAGLPPVVPPVRPIPTEALQAPEDETVEDVASDLQQFRPRTRPGGLIERTERVQLGGWTRSELAAFRPNVRPETLKAVEEEAQPEATQFAVAQSIEPVNRPRNFARIVTRAQELRETQRQTQTTQVAAVAPRTVQPRIPSSASVARQATVNNAINLRRINLIGVYGKPSNRRALVRLSNGRYQKVEVGDRLDGGRVAAIGNSELRYTKNGRNVVLDMPDG